MTQETKLKLRELKETMSDQDREEILEYLDNLVEFRGSSYYAILRIIDGLLELGETHD